MTAGDALRTAELLHHDGYSDSDTVTHNDIDTAADLAGADRPATPSDRDAVRIALDVLINT